MPNTITEAQVATFTKAAEEQMLALHMAAHPGWTLELPKLSYMMGQRYARIVKKDYTASQGGSCFCFLDLTNGDVLKSASWKAPAKGARGNLSSPTGGLEGVTQYGGRYAR